MSDHYIVYEDSTELVLVGLKQRWETEGQNPAHFGDFSALAHQLNLAVTCCTESGVFELENHQTVQESSQQETQFPTPRLE